MAGTSRRPARRLVVASLVAVVLAVGACTDGDDGGSAGPAEDGATSTSTSTSASQADDGHRGVSSVPEIVREVGPTVVAVLAGKGAGSGVIFDEEGLIVTNHHVAAQGSDLRVVLANGDELPAELVAGDERSDLAVLRVSRTGLPEATFAEELPDVGELAIAVGNPLGFDSSVSQGIISGIQRTLPVPGPAGQALVDLIQTDAVEQLLETGQVRLGFLGVTVVPVTPQLAQRFDLGVESGVVVLDVVDGGPAAEGGVRSGDVVVALGGEEVGSLRDFLSALHRLDVGEEAQVEVIRDGEETEVQVTIGERPDS